MARSNDQRFPPANLHRIRPEQSLLARGVGAAVAFIVPASVVMYLLTVPRGPWIYVLITELIILAGATVAIILFRRSGMWVGRNGIAERGFFGATRFVPINEIGSIVLVQTFESDGTDSTPQFFICDPKGTQLIRMRGQYWSRKKMDFVSETLRIPANEIADPLTTSELLEEYPGLLYWFERHPWLAGVIFTASVIIGGILLYVALTTIGTFSPIR